MSTNKKEVVAKMSVEQILVVCGNKSNAIRYLTSLQYSRGEIAKILNIRYQHVKNVLDQECKKIDIAAKIVEIDSKMVDGKIEDTNQLSLEL